MPTRHVICCDGTWNKPDTNLEDQIDENTNVVKFRDSVMEGDVNEEWKQRVEYLFGVGTREDHKPDGTLMGRVRAKLGERADDILGKVEGGTGLGLSSRLVKGYQYLCANYKTGDQIYIVGFSRGAFTACSLAGMICRMGLVEGASMAEAWTLYSFYINHKHEAGKLDEFREHLFAGRHVEPQVEFLGVWDVVGSLGLAGGVGQLLQKVWGKDPTNTLEKLHDTALHPKIKNAYHALALHEYRIDFKPTLWDTKPEAHQKVQQAWFAGAHSNVGGGYQHKLSAIPLAWLMKKAQACGLRFKKDSIPVIDDTNYMEEAHDSYTDFMKPFDLSELVKQAIADGKEHLLPAGVKEFMEQGENWVEEKAGAVADAIKKSPLGGFFGDLLPDVAKPQLPDVKKLFPLYYRPLGELKNDTEFVHPSVLVWLKVVPKPEGGAGSARTLHPTFQKIEILTVLPE